MDCLDITSLFKYWLKTLFTELFFFFLLKPINNIFIGYNNYII